MAASAAMLPCVTARSDAQLVGIPTQWTRRGVLVADRGPLDGVEQVSSIADGAGQREFTRGPERRLAHVGTARGSTPARLEPDQSATGCGYPNGAGPVIAVRDGHGAGRHERGGTTAGPAHAALQVPWLRVGPCLTTRWRS